MKKIRYEIDPHNSLVTSGSGRRSSLPRFRKVIDGRFKVDENNDLFYHIKAPYPEDEKVPRQIKLKGEWSLTDDHRLRLTLDTWSRATFGDRITLEGEILDVNANSLLFAVTTTSKEGSQSTHLLNLSGIWKADENNRLSFHVKKEGGRYDILTLGGAWQINEGHQIIYQYERARLIRKKKRVHTLIFKGYWDIKDAFRVSYILSKGTDSVFDFKISAGTLKEDRIQYEVGIGAGHRIAPVTRAITLFGRWNLKKDANLSFEIEYEGGKTRSIAFGADAKLTDKDTILFRLKSMVENKDIGMTLELSREILRGGETFIRALKSGRESALFAGAAWRW
ncbi:MAG: hypothetical protein Q8R14_02435 [Candidatus Omnitrophota bacterium]|nr:hypothetical protein [Candidatus Omnitrophota bacterium]